MEDPNIADSDPVADEVLVDLHVLRPLMLDGVGGEIHGIDSEMLLKIIAELICCLLNEKKQGKKKG